MKNLNLRSKVKKEYIEIPADFIDLYMPAASPEALKVYLYLLRAELDPSALMSVTDMAELFDVTPNRILQALSYWETQGLLSLSFDDDDLTEIVLLPMPEDEHAKSAEPVSAVPTAPAAAVPVQAAPAPEASYGVRSIMAVEAEQTQYGQNSQNPYAQTAQTPYARPAQESYDRAAEENPLLDISVLDYDDNFSDLLALAEYYMKKPLTSSQRNTLGTCYLIFDRQSDVVEFLLEYCIDQGHYSFRYIEAVARGWKEEGYSTLAEIRSGISSRSKNVYSIMNAFGLKNRAPAKSEADFIAGWTHDFDLPIILEACNRTMASIHTPSFEYTNSILATWKNANVRTMTDISRLDEQRHIQPRSTEKEQRPAAKKPNAYVNFDQRTTDYDAIIASFTKSKK